MGENNQTKNTTILAIDVVGYSAKKWTKLKEALLKSLKMLGGMKMRNNHIGFQEYIKFELKNKYGYSWW